MLHWIWSWNLQLNRLIESTNNDGSGATDIEQRKSFSAASLDLHLLLVVGQNFVRAYIASEANLRGTGISEQLLRKLTLLRNLYEHWDEQQPIFQSSGIKKKSGKEFSDKYPKENPWSITYKKNDWVVGGVMSLKEISEKLSELEQHISHSE